MGFLDGSDRAAQIRPDLLATLGGRTDRAGPGTLLISDALGRDEQVFVAMYAVDEKNHGCVVVVTDRRLLSAGGSLIGNQTLVAVARGDVIGVTQAEKAFAFSFPASVTVRTAAGFMEWKFATVANAERIAAALRTQPVIVPQPVTVVSTDLMTNLRELAEMRTAGILTDDEFASAKARLLARG
jgi:hypothetical protein